MNYFTPNNNDGQTKIKDNVASRIINSLKKGNAEDKKIGEIIDLIHSGSNNISSDDEEVYMVLGLTGAGKTTLTAYLSGVELVIRQEKLENPQQIEDKKQETDESSEDENNSISDRSRNYLDYKTTQEGYGEIGVSDLESQTLIPNKFVAKNGSIFWDCPGFSDSRGEEIDIAKSYYISKISKYAKKMKFVLVIDGSCLESKGFGSNKGDHFKVLIETLFQMSKDTTIDYSEQLTIIITRVSKSKTLDYFKKKLEKLFTDLLGQNSFVDKLLKFFKKSDFEKFFYKLKKANVCLFRQPKGKDGDTFSDDYRERIQKQLNKSKFYTGVNISVPHSIRSLERVAELWRYTRNELSSKFYKLCESLGQEVQQMSADDFTKVSELIQQFEKKEQYDSPKSNSQFLSVIKNEFLTPLTQIIETRYEISDESIQMRKSLIEEIEFFLVEVYDGLLLGIRFTSKTEEFFGKISFYELQQGMTELYRAIKQKQNSISFEKLQQLKDELHQQNMSADQQQKLLEEEIKIQVQLRDQLDKQQQELVQKQLEIQKAIQEASQSSFILQFGEDIATGAKIGDKYGTVAGGSAGFGGGLVSGAFMGSAFGPVGTLIGGLIGGIAGTGVGGLVGKGVGIITGASTGAICSGVKSVYQTCKTSECRIF